MLPHSRKYGAKPSYPIYVWNGILEIKHRKKIGPALWHFIWLINAITKEKDGIGLVLGGAPVLMAEVAASLGESERTTRKNFDRLELHRYIKRTRTPYGYVIRILNSRKFADYKAPKRTEETFRSVVLETGPNLPISSAKPSDLSAQTFRSNKSKQLEKAEEEAVAAAPDTLTPWKTLGSDLPMGSRSFQGIFEHYFATRNGNPLSDAMERAIQAANRSGVGVPPKFFEAKRVVELHEVEELAAPSSSNVPELEDLPWAEKR